MLDNKELNIIEKKFSLLNIILSVLLLLYYFLFVWFDYEELGFNTFIFSGLITCFVIEYILSQYEFIHSDFIFKIIKFSELLAAAAIISASAGLETSVIIYTMIYIMVSFQVIITYDITETYSMIESIIFNIVPMCIWMFYHLIFDKHDNFWSFMFIIFTVIFFVCLMNITKGFAEIISRLFNKITQLDDIAYVNRKENDDMKTTKDKLVHTNEQLSIQRFKLQEANERIIINNAEMKLQREITKRFLDSLDIQELPDIIANEVFNSLDCDLFSMNVLYRTDNNKLIWIHKSKYSDRSLIREDTIEQIESKDFVIDFCNKNEILRIDDYVNLKLDYFLGTNMKSVIIYPIKFNDNILATYMFGNTFKNKYGDKDDFLHSLVNQITMTLSNAFMYYEMKVMATKDALTGIYNRRYFNSIVGEYKTKYIDNHIDVTVVLFDIDKFKTVNDSYGHIFGDGVISFCGKVADEFAVKNDALPVRYGGEEFVMVFPNKTSDEVEHICQELHKTIKEKNFECNGENIHIDISIGIANYPNDENSFEEIINCADNAMYYSKEHGRGRITVYGRDMN